MNRTRSLDGLYARGRMWAGAALCALAAGCHYGRAVEAYVPVKANAAEQYAYAVQQRNQRNLGLIPLDEQERFMDTREIVRQVIERVPENFPEDRKSTPLARLDLVEMDAGLDSRRVETSDRQRRKAIGEFEKLMKDYPEYDFIRAKSLYDMGQCYLLLGDFAKAQNSFYEAREGFKDNPDELIRSIAKRSDFYYNQTFVNGEKKKRSGGDSGKPKITSSPIP